MRPFSMSAAALAAAFPVDSFACAAYPTMAGIGSFFARQASSLSFLAMNCGPLDQVERQISAQTQLGKDGQVGAAPLGESALTQEFLRNCRRSRRQWD